MEISLKDKEEKLKAMIDESKKIVFFGGAGVSTESGVPDFRSVDGLYHEKWKYPPETMLSHTFFVNHTDEFYEYYFEKLLVSGIEPNPAHYALSKLEDQGKLTGVVTQNIDGLHQKAGSKKVFELHGSIHRNYCTSCRKFFDSDYMLSHNKNDEGKYITPRCDNCGSIIKPDVVLYEEGLPGDTLNGAIDAIRKADMMIVGGTSLVVYPAAGLIDYFSGKYLVVINMSETGRDKEADLLINGRIGEVLGSVIA